MSKGDWRCDKDDIYIKLLDQERCTRNNDSNGYKERRSNIDATTIYAAEEEKTGGTSSD